MLLLLTIDAAAAAAFLLMLGGVSFGSPPCLDRALSDFCSCCDALGGMETGGCFVVLRANIIGNPAEP